MLRALTLGGFSQIIWPILGEKYEKINSISCEILAELTVFPLIIFIEIAPNYEFYKNADVRPPFTYATLIRQVSRGKLTLAD